MIKDSPNTQIDSKDPSFEQVQGINKQGYDARLLRNKELVYFAFDVWSSSGATGDGTFRVLKLIGNNGDRETSYTQEIITSLGNTTAKITRSGNMFVQGDSFILPSGHVLEAFASIYTATQNVEIRLTGSSFRYVRGTSRNLTTTNDNFAVINSGATDIIVDLRFATSASDRPIFGLFFKIY
ncbi:MAG TPA: hypothetical protein PLW93_00635 [Candidatus Absconditabacterales bacterium]|nr:hypothetical protein [Candidatus Absconditabacterales bacterium]